MESFSLNKAILWSYSLQFLSAIPWTILLCFIPFIRLFHLRTGPEYRCLQKKLENRCSVVTDGNRGYGYACGRWFIAYLCINKEAWIITTPYHFKQMMKNNNDQIYIHDYENMEDEQENQEPGIPETIRIFDRLGDYATPYYKKRNIEIFPLTARPFQKQMMESIQHHYEKHSRTVVFLSGPPNTGKSIMGLLLSTHYKSSYCTSFKPWQPGDVLGELYGESEPKKENPFILVLDEIDVALSKIHTGISPHLQIPISVADKQGWNNFLDQIHWGMFPYMIVLLISNKPMEFIDNLDPSYLRAGRVDLKFTTQSRGKNREPDSESESEVDS